MQSVHALKTCTLQMFGSARELHKDALPFMIIATACESHLALAHSASDDCGQARRAGICCIARVADSIASWAVHAFRA
jgi:hypothetical protein